MLSMLLAMLETEEDRERFLKLHGAYEKKLYAVAVRVLGDRTAAEDAVQQTWLQLIRRWDRVSGLAWSETEGYLVTAVKNVAVDMLRKERREEALPEDCFAGRLRRLGGVRFWRVQRGPYATYFIPTINCVSLTNELLEKTDIGRTVMLGLKTPGAYLDLLEREYLAGNPVVTARRVYDRI